MRIAIVTPEIQSRERLFGAERLFVGLVDAFQQKVDTDWIRIPVSERTWDDVLQSYLDCFDLELSRYDLVVSTKNPTYMVQHQNHVCWLLHQIRVFYDRFEDEYGNLPEAALARKREQRDTIRRLDNLAFQRVRKIFSISYETASRLSLYNGFDAEVLYPPVLKAEHYCGAQKYFLLPGRLHRWKRVNLAIEAMKYSPGDTPLLIAGTGEDEEHFRRLAGDDPRIRFLGFVSDKDLVALYADALGVLFFPKEEDFGYVAIEAMLSHKPAIVCTDSGEPSRLVQNGRSGFVVRPDAMEIAAAMGILAGDRALARTMGEFAFQNAPAQSWSGIVDRILEAGVGPTNSVVSLPATEKLAAPADNSIALLVADNQVLDPPVGGGRIRIYELYRHLAAHDFEVCYVGAYDWPGPTYSDKFLAPHFREIVTPLTQPHFTENRLYERATGGKTTIDVTIPRLLKFSPRYRRLAEEHGAGAAAIVISHPWVYPHVPRRSQQKLIYDAHNCEFLIKQQILGDTTAGRDLVQGVRDLESSLCRDADLIFVCSEDDADQFVTLYGVSREKIVLVPNGVDVTEIQPATREQRLRARSDLQLPMDKPVLIFIGSGYGPNTEAAAFLVQDVAPALPECTVAIAGSVRDSYAAQNNSTTPENVVWTGVIDSQQRRALYQAADIALNPMFSGSGTNLKMLDYFAAGLPVVSTPAGARGLNIAADTCVVCPVEEFVPHIRSLLDNDSLRENMGRAARQLAVERYAWTLIAERAAMAMHDLLREP
jgi:glycosyltransferase involved in cell wall biosynthesis